MAFNITFEKTQVANPEGKLIGACTVKANTIEIARFLGPGACGRWLFQLPDLNHEYSVQAEVMFSSLEEGKQHILRQVRLYEAALVRAVPPPSAHVYRRGDPVWVLVGGDMFEAVISTIRKASFYVVFAPSGGGTLVSQVQVRPKEDTEATRACRATFRIAPKWQPRDQGSL